MKAARGKAAVAALLMIGAFVGATAWKPTQHLVQMQGRIELEATFPRQFGDWAVDDRGPVQLVSPDQQAALSKFYDQTLSRLYVNAVTGDRIMLSVAYGGDQSDATRAHRPEVCYPAQGFQISNATNTSIDLQGRELPLRRLAAQQGGRHEPITYWITVGERTTTTGTQQKLAQLSYSSRGVIPDGMLVRVSSIDRDDARAWKVQEAFIRALAPAVPHVVQARVLGRAST